MDKIFGCRVPTKSTFIASTEPTGNNPKYYTRITQSKKGAYTYLTQIFNPNYKVAKVVERQRDRARFEFHRNGTTIRHIDLKKEKYIRPKYAKIIKLIRRIVPSKFKKLLKTPKGRWVRF